MLGQDELKFLDYLTNLGLNIIYRLSSSLRKVWTFYISCLVKFKHLKLNLNAFKNSIETLRYKLKDRYVSKEIIYIYIYIYIYGRHALYYIIYTRFLFRVLLVLDCCDPILYRRIALIVGCFFIYFLNHY